MTEACCQFGDQRHLAGIVTLPDPTARRIALVLVSAGLSPKWGPYRLYLQLARRVSRDGFPTLRFDLGGIGDSGKAHASLGLQARTELEIRAALDYVTGRYPVDGVVLGGLCSGAEDSFRYAEKDPRVVGVMMIDPFAYRTAGWRWRHELLRAAKRVWGAGNAPSGDGGESLIDYKYMEREESGRILRVLIDRKVHMHFLYTGGMSDFFNHRGQLEASFAGIDFKGQVSVDHLPRLGHTQLLDEDRRQIVESIARCLTSTYRA